MITVNTFFTSLVLTEAEISYNKESEIMNTWLMSSSQTFPVFSGSNDKYEGSNPG